MNFIALHYSFLTMFELCCQVFLLWRDEVKDFFSLLYLFLFVFLSMKTTSNNMISKLREGATIIVSWENWPKKEGACSKRDINSNRLRKSNVDYKIRLTLQSLLLCHFIQFTSHISQAPMICPKCHTCPVSHGPCMKMLACAPTK